MGEPTPPSPDAPAATGKALARARCYE